MHLEQSHDYSLGFSSDMLRNTLLKGLQKHKYEKILIKLEQVKLTSGDPLGEPGKPMAYAYFPIDAIVSLLCAMDDGDSTEVAMVGSEGMVGVSLVLGEGKVPGRAIVQSTGSAYRLKSKWLWEAFDQAGDFQKRLLGYMRVLMVQMSQMAVCNRHHTLDQQLCRWLLSSLDRLPAHELVVTQEFMASMLGVRREGVTEVAGKLQRAGLISYHRGRISILDRSGLEARACECYQVVKKELCQF